MKKSFWITLRDILVNILKGKVVKMALVKFLGSAAAGGITGWLVTFIVEELFERVAEPIIRMSFRKGALFYDKTEGKLMVRKIRKAKEGKDEEEYRRTIGNV